MPLILQDVVVTLITAGAAATLIVRLITLVRPAHKKNSCGGCNTCSPSRR